MNSEAKKAILKIPKNTLIFNKRGECSYCDKTVNIRAQVGVRGEKNKWLSGASCLECVNQFLPENTKLVEVNMQN